jgi:hypothetical protein
LSTHLPTEVAGRKPHHLLEPPREVERIMEAEIGRDLIERIVRLEQPTASTPNNLTYPFPCDKRYAKVIGYVHAPL